jgi:hypothetical protein
VFAACLLALATGARAEATRSWTAHAATLARGDADGVAISSQGRISLAPRLARLLEDEGGGAYVWTMAVDPAGNMFLGTGPEGRVLRVSPSGRATTWFATAEPLVTAMAFAPGGDLLVAAAPGGLIYRIDPEGSGGVWTEVPERYVWSLAVAPDGSIFAGTGERGAVVKISPSGRTEPFFDSREEHIVSLALRGDGSLLAGGAGPGTVYEIDPEGNGIVRYADELDEVVGVVGDADGALVAALIAAPARERRPPALRLQLPDGAEVGATVDPMAGLDETEGATVRGVIEGLSAGPDGDMRGARGRIVRIAPDGRATVLWSSATEAPYSIARGADGRIRFGTGEPARLYAIESAGADANDDDDLILQATLDESQVTAMAATGGALLLATSNPVSAYRVEGRSLETGVFLSPAFDAGSSARWGSIRWELDGTGGRAELYTRTGNSEIPDDTWSAWSPSMIDGSGNGIENPDGRYLQWRARFVGGPSTTRLSGVTVDYAPHNRPPEARDFESEADDGAVSGTASFTVALRDPDDDAVEVVLEYRRRGQDGWTRAEEAAQPEDDPSKPVEGWRKKELRWATDDLVEGEYDVRAFASDQPSNHPGEGHRVPLGPVRIVVDRTPPKMQVRRSGGQVEVVIEDDHSRVRRLQVRDADRRVLATIRAADGVCDSPREAFRFDPPPDGTRRVLVGFDAAGNTVELPLLPG